MQDNFKLYFINQKKMKKITISVIFLLLCHIALGQITFEKTYGGSNYDYGYSVQQTNDNGYIITGYTKSFGAGSADVYLIKTDENGDTLWTKTYGGTKYDCGQFVQQTNDNGYIITGSTKSFGNDTSDVYLIKTDENGDTLWTKIYGGIDEDCGYSVRQTNDSGYVIAGETKSFGAGNFDVYLIKTDKNGDTLWTKTFGGIYDDKGYSMQQTSDSGYIITGMTWSFGAGDNDAFLIKTDKNGDTLWTKTYGGSEKDYAYCVQQTNDNGYIITGLTWSFGAGSDDIYLIKTDENGDTLWTKTFGGIYWEYGKSVEQTNDNGFIITGITWSYCVGYGDIYLIKTDENGDTSWTKTFGGSLWDYGRAIQKTNDNGYIIAGETKSSGAGAGDVYLIKTNKNGNIITKVNEINDSDVIQIYPNPGNGIFNLKIKNIKKGKLSIEIINVEGQLIYKKQFDSSPQTKKINLSNQAKGIYFVKIITSSNAVVKKIIIQ